MILSKFPFLLESNRRIVGDLYDPLVLENIHLYQDEPLALQESLNSQTVAAMNRLLSRADFFICGNERQHDFWIGALAANGRVNPHSTANDPDLNQLIAVVGVGFPERDPQGDPIFHGKHPSFPPEAKIVLWGGGIWDWLDPLTLVNAWPEVLLKQPAARLVFLGTRHPNPLVPPHQMAEKTLALAAQIGEKDRTIYFIGWLPYQEREGLLCEAAVGVALHPLHLETRYSIRTRVLDYFWAKLPVLVTDGDISSAWVQSYHLGKVVPPLDSQAVAGALVELLETRKEDWAAFYTPLREQFAWSNVVNPLRRYCLQSRPNPDREKSPDGLLDKSHKIPGRALFARARFILRTEGARVLLTRALKYVQWRLSS